MPTVPSEPHALLETQTEPFHIGNRTRSTALLAWFIETVMRLDKTEVEDAICDGGGDKGIDGIVFDEDANEIFVLQAKHRQNPATTQGDADLQRFLGVAPYFDGAAGIASLLASSPNAEVVALVERLKLAQHLADSSPTVRLVFVTNAPRDPAARDYLATLRDQTPTIDLWDRDRLVEVAVRTARRELLAGKYMLHDVGEVLSANLTGAAQIGLALVPASELVRLPGIENLTIFDLNVRLGLGNTKINRELRATITNAAEHELFPAYHNGLTLLTDGLRVTDEGIELDGVAVVNGCQSLLALYRERASITPELRLVTKVVELGAVAELADRITYRSNNQNPVNIRDQRSNDRIQRDLQEQVEDQYAGLRSVPKPPATLLSPTSRDRRACRLRSKRCAFSDAAGAATKAASTAAVTPSHAPLAPHTRIATRTAKTTPRFRDWASVLLSFRGAMTNRPTETEHVGGEAEPAGQAPYEPILPPAGSSPQPTLANLQRPRVSCPVPPLGGCPPVGARVTHPHRPRRTQAAPHRDELRT